METMNKDSLVSYEELASITTLNENERGRDELFLASAHVTVENYLGRVLAAREVCEVDDCEGNMVFVRETPIVDVKEVAGSRSGESYEIKKVLGDCGMIMLKDEPNESCLVTYTAGFTVATLPADLEEAIVKTFLYKKKTMGGLENGGDKKLLEILPRIGGDVMELLEPYRRKTV